MCHTHTSHDGHHDRVQYREKKRNNSASTQVGNFIIGASGSDKQMLCRSSVACAAPIISNVNKIQKG